MKPKQTRQHSHDRSSLPSSICGSSTRETIDYGAREPFLFSVLSRVTPYLNSRALECVRLLVTIPCFRPFAQRIRMVHMCKAAALQAVLSLKPADLWASNPQ